jgi:CHRD domain
MKKIVLVLFALALPQFSWGQLITFDTVMTGPQETPPTPSPAIGTGVATLNLNTLLFNFNYSFTGLLGPETDAHIHLAPPGVPGPIIIPLPLGDPVSFSTTITPSQANDLLSGLWYANIHSTVFPAGEIRGQLVAVPEPATYAAGFVGLIGLLVMRRRFSKKAASTPAIL